MVQFLLEMGRQYRGGNEKLQVTNIYSFSYNIYRRLVPKQHLNPSTNDKFYSSKLKEFANDNFKFVENGRRLSKREKKMREKEKLLITSNSSLSHNVFKRLVLQTHKRVNNCEPTFHN